MELLILPQQIKQQGIVQLLRDKHGITIELLAGCNLLKQGYILKPTESKLNLTQIEEVEK